jgi:hypothetical protein
VTQPRDDDYEEVPGAGDLPDDVKNGDIGEDDPNVVDQPPDTGD